MEKKRKIWVITLVAIAVLFGSLFAWQVIKSMMIKSFISKMQAPPVVISATKARSESVKPTLTAVGSLLAVNGIEISNELAGVVSTINFQSGQMVKKDDILLTLNSNVEKAALDSSKAARDLSRVQYERQQKLLKAHAVSQADLDSAKANYDQAEALVAQNQAIFDKKIITAPYDGRLGIRKVSLGQYLPAGTPLVGLQSINPILINFYLPEQNVTLLQPGQDITLTLDAYPEKTFTGKISAINSEVDVNSRNILVQGELQNAEELLHPGMFGTVAIHLPIQNNMILVPQTAIDYNYEGSGVYVLEKQSAENKEPISYHATRIPVAVGESVGKNVVITSSRVHAGDLIVTAGQSDQLGTASTIFVVGTEPGQ